MWHLGFNDTYLSQEFTYNVYHGELLQDGKLLEDSMPFFGAAVCSNL